MEENLIREDGFYQTFLALIIHHSITTKDNSTEDSTSQANILEDKSINNSAPILESNIITENKSIKDSTSQADTSEDDYINNSISQSNTSTENTHLHLLKTDPSYRKKVILKAGHAVQTVLMIAPVLLPRIIKPQQLIQDDPDYYIAIDQVTNTYYVCYRTLMMIDVDWYKDDNETSIDDRQKLTIQKIKDYCADNPQLCFRLYSSQGGLHAFLTSQESHYRDPLAIQMMLDLTTDFYYVVHCYLRGWSVRLNKKKVDMKDELYQYIDTVGSGQEIQHLVNLTQLHINLVPVFIGVGVNTMYGGQL